MKSKSVDLESTVLVNPEGAERAVQVGDSVFLLGPELFRNHHLLNNRKLIVWLANKTLGKGAYEIYRIHKRNQAVYIDLKGNRGKIMKDVSTQYLGAC